MRKDMPEFVLACACCGWPLTDARLRAVRDAAASISDWDKFLRVVDRHRIAGLVHNALARAEVGVPQHIKAGLASRAQEIAAHNLLTASETIRLQRLFDEKEIPVLFVKGATLAQLAYGSLSLKHALDIDFLVLPKHAQAAHTLLEDNGYAPLSGPLDDRQRRALFHGATQAGLVHKTTGLKIEMHWALMENPKLLAGVDALSPTQAVFLSPGHGVRTLANDDLFAYLCAHGAYHAWMRLKWLADLSAFISSMPHPDIERLYRHADAKGAGLCAGQALLLCEELLGLALPAPLAQELHGSKRLLHLSDLALDALIGKDGETEVMDRPFGTLRISFSHFLLGRGLRYGLAQWRTILMTPRDVIDYPLPSFLYFAYPVLRIPLHLWRLVVYRGRAAPFPDARNM